WRPWVDSGPTIERQMGVSIQSTNQLARTESAAKDASFPPKPVYLAMSARTSSNSTLDDSYGAACVGKRMARGIVESTSGGLNTLALNSESGAAARATLDWMCC